MNQRERMRRREKKAASDRFGPENFHTRPSIQLRIDELFLHDADFARRERIADAFQSELTNKITEGGLPKHALTTSARERIDGGTISLQRMATAERIGTDIARAVYGGLNTTKRSGREDRKS